MQETNLIGQGQPAEAVPSDLSSAPAPTMTLCSNGNKLTREELAQVKTPAGKATHKFIPHIDVVEKLIEALRLSPDRCRARRIRRVIRRHEDVRRDGADLRLRWMPVCRRVAEQPRQVFPPELHRWPESLRLRKPRLSGGIDTRDNLNKRSHQHFHLDPAKIKRAQQALHAKTETEAIERSLDFAIAEHEKTAWLFRPRSVEQEIRERGTELRQILGLAPQSVAVFGPSGERLYANRVALIRRL